MHCVPLIYFRTEKPGEITDAPAAPYDRRQREPMHVPEIPA